MSELPRVLVVDDQPTNLQVVGGVLRDGGQYRVSFAQSGEEALMLVDNQAPDLAPDLILLDVMMPGLGGLEVCRKLKSTPVLSAIPIIFLTAKSQAKDMVEGFEMGGADYITKPFEPAVLLSRVNAHLQLYLYSQREEEMRSQERITSYQNGLTEMGASMLHNIGNAMVGVNSRLPPIHDMVKKMGDLGGALEIAHSMLKNEKDEERVLQILSLSSKLLKEEYAVILGEDSRNLKESVYHVNEIINAQRNLTAKGLMSSHFHLSSLISDVTTLLGDEMKKREIKLVIKEEVGVPEVFLPRSPMGQMMVNLIKNSYESLSLHVQRGGIRESDARIEVRLCLDEKMDGVQFWRLEVADNGVGIAQEQLSQVLLSGYTSKSSGSGLGLHSAANFAVAVGGKLSVESDGEGKGATVLVVLPQECQKNCYQINFG